MIEYCVWMRSADTWVTDRDRKGIDDAAVWPTYEAADRWARSIQPLALDARLTVLDSEGVRVWYKEDQ
jgi:hypothetical protein